MSVKDHRLYIFFSIFELVAGLSSPNHLDEVNDLSMVFDAI